MIDAKSRLLGLYAKKDVDSVITECDEMFLQYTGAKSKDEIVGHTDFEFVWQEYAPLYRKHELDILSGNEYSAIIPVKDADNNTLLFLHNKIRTLDEKGEVDGLIVRAMEILNPNYHELITSLTKINTQKKPVFALGKKINDIELSVRQKQCLFFLLYGKTAKAIANILKISPRTVETHIDNMKIKFGCRSKSELIDAAINLGFLDVLPPFNNAEEIAKALAE